MAKKRTKISYALIATSFILLLLAILFTLEKTGITNFYQSDQPKADVDTATMTSEVPSAKPTNTVDYSSDNNSDSSPIPDKSTVQAQTAPSNLELAVVLIRSFVSEGRYYVKGIITGTDSATCSVTMTRGSLFAAASSGAELIEGQYSCKDLSIPMEQLTESGEWNLQLTVTDKAGATASTSTGVIL